VKILEKILEYASTYNLAILFFILVDLDQTLIDCKMTQIIVCYIYILFFHEYKRFFVLFS